MKATAEQEGLVENVPWKGARVVLLTMNDVEDLFLTTADARAAEQRGASVATVRTSLGPSMARQE